MSVPAPLPRLLPEPPLPQGRTGAASADPPGVGAGHGPLRGLLLLLLLVVIVAATLLWSPPAWGASDAVVLQRGARLFDKHCVGCHINGGNVVRRNKTLRRQDLLRQGIDSPEQIARIASNGRGQMSSYGAVLGEGGPEAVGEWVWRQAELGWPRR